MSKKNNDINSGIDERFPIKNFENEMKTKIVKYNNYSDLIKKLESSISIIDKLKIVEMNDNTSSYKNIDIRAGGLFTDWDFEEFS
jgi:hypothetical protein